MRYWDMLAVDTDTFQRADGAIRFQCVCGGDESDIWLDPFQAVFNDMSVDTCLDCGRKYRMSVSIEVAQEHTK